MDERNTGADTNPKDDELAACIAAVYAYQALLAAEQEFEEPKKSQNQWVRQARLKGCGLAITDNRWQSQHKDSLWQLSSRGLLGVIQAGIFALSLSVFSSPNAHAQDEASQQIAFDRYPPLEAPPLRSGYPTAFPPEAPPVRDRFDTKNVFRPSDSQTLPGIQLDRSAYRLKIGLNINATTCNITLPDGAELIDKNTAELLAELPPQSIWQVGLDQDAAGPGRKVSFSGQIGNLGTARVLLAKTPGVYQEAEFSTYEGQTSANSGFKKQPYVLEELNPKFWFGLENSYEQPYSKQGYRPIGYTSPNTPPLPKSTSYILRPLNPGGVFGLDGKTYRGQLLIEAQNSGPKAFSVINLVDIEDYLLSVVPSEMPSSWCLEALKAQAIAARSYAIANMGKHQKDGYDLKASTEDQVYTGVQAEADTTNTAVSETTGLVIKHANKPISAFFHSAAGGFTETAENVWSNELPYLKSVPDFDDQSPHFNWKRNYSLTDVESRLLKSGFDVGGILGLFPLSRAGSQRVKSVLVSGSLKTIVVSGEDMRRIFTLPSTVFNIAPAENGYILAGRGFGHGLGLSQWGARYLGENGYNAAQIISYYYKDVSVEPF